MRLLSSDNPKASLMEHKRFLIVRAARHAFLEGGYARTSMDAIAVSAGVGIKTLYRHFENKDDLFSAVMQAACNPEAFDESTGEWKEPSDPPERPWFARPPRTGMVAAGVEYLQHILSAEQVALYRVVAQDAHNFPELGHRYREQVIERSHQIFIGYLVRWARAEKWRIRNRQRAAQAFTALLRAGVFDEALHGATQLSAAGLRTHARRAAAQMLILLQASCF